MHPAPVKVLLVDDDEDDCVITREMLSSIPTGKFELDWAATVEAGLAAIVERRPDVCLVDYRMGERDGLDFMRRVIEAGVDVPMVMMTGRGDHHIDVEAMRIGAAGYLVKGELQPSLLERTLRHAMVRAARWGGGDADLIRACEAAIAGQGSIPRLSDREHDVAKLIADGRSNKEIAIALAIGVPTVKKHVGRVLKKVGLQDRLQLGLFLARNPITLRRVT